MGGDLSAYAALGLGPDADSDEVERAYKRLIKLHHPDKTGGNPARAAEINRAYRELSARPGPQPGLEFHERMPASRKWRPARLAFALVVGIAAILVAAGPGTAWMRQLSPKPPHAVTAVAARAAPDVMDQPLSRAAIGQGVNDALRLVEARNDAALLGASRDCHEKLRLQPSIAALDRCAAFDDAVLQLQDREPMWDRGPFSQLAVTGRLWSAASVLSNDYLAVDSRLERVRLQVELLLSARQPAPSKASAG